MYFHKNVRLGVIHCCVTLSGEQLKDKEWPTKPFMEQLARAVRECGIETLQVEELEFLSETALKDLRGLEALGVTVSASDGSVPQLLGSGGEHWLQSTVPYCYPGELQRELLGLLEKEPHLAAVGLRIAGSRGHLLGSLNEVNLYAACKLVKDPYLSVERLWHDWTVERFGSAAAPAIISALARTGEIGSRVYYMGGVLLYPRGELSALSYLDRLDFEPFVLSVGSWEAALQHIKEKRQGLLLMNERSLADIDTVKRLMPKDTYRRLHAGLVLQRRFLQAALPHCEAFLRYRIHRQEPAYDNLIKLGECLRQLDRIAEESEAIYGGTESILRAADIREYIAEVERFVAK